MRKLRELDGGRSRDCWNAQPSIIERGECQTKSTASAPDEIFSRNLHVIESKEAVFNGANPHKPAAVKDLKARCVGLDDECRDFINGASRFGGLFTGFGHHNDQISHHTIGAPELFAIEGPSGAIF